MKLEFENPQWFGNNTPNFIGRKEHGQEVMFDIDSDSKDTLGCYGERVSIHIYADKTIWLTKLTYNSREEEYEDKLVKDLTDNEEVVNAINDFLIQNPIYQSSQFPYSLELSKGLWQKEDIKLDSIDKVVKFAKQI